MWAWGFNHLGQLGDGTRIERIIPVQVSGLSGVIAISSGAYHAIALKNDGTMWSWGYNYYGQLGDGTTTNRITPVQVNDLSGIKAIATGITHCMVLKNDGTVMSWGDNSSGQLGNGESGYQLLPKYVFGTPKLPDEYTLMLINLGIKDFSNKIFHIEYDANELELIDLCTMTEQKETTLGIINGTGITITQSQPGLITFTVDKSIPINQKWSGIVNCIRFNEKTPTGRSSIKYTVQ